MSFRFAATSALRTGAFILTNGFVLALATSTVSAQPATAGAGASAGASATAGASSTPAASSTAATAAAHAKHGGGQKLSVAVGPLSVEEPWARATAPGAAVAGGFLTLRNDGDGDRLVAAESPAAGRVELHTMSMQDNVMRMRKLEAIELPAGERVELRPGEHHLMFMDLRGPLKEGEAFPVKLRFEKAGEVEVQVQVRSMGAQAGSH